jgi:hypothetical protein
MSISCKWDRAQGTITWTSDLKDKEGKLVYEPVIARISTMSAELKERGLFHGIAARGTDATAMGFDHWDGKDKPKRYATDQEKLARCRKIIGHLNDSNTGWDWDLRPGRKGDPLEGKSAEELGKLIAEAQAKLAAIGIK